MIEIRQIQAAETGVDFPQNEPFESKGKLVPTFDGNNWSYTIDEFSEVFTTCFPYFDYDRQDSSLRFYGAFDGEKCIGLAVYRKGMFAYRYLEDLKVNQAYRGQGIASRLIRAGLREAVKDGEQGVYTIAQDNNLSACLFYLSQGFEIGGFDNRSYRGTIQEDKADIYFYLDGKAR